MAKKTISAGVVHDLPEDLEQVLLADPPALISWEGITPLARNEWICWIEEARKPKTRLRRIERAQEDLKKGKKRPCCWPGCFHREKTGHP